MAKYVCPILAFQRTWSDINFLSKVTLNVVTIPLLRNGWYRMSPFHGFEVEFIPELIRTVMPKTLHSRPGRFDACNVAQMHGKL